MNRFLLKGLCLLVAFIPFFFSLQAQNLIDMSGWSIGQGSTGIFYVNGQASENIREWGEGPHGDRVIVWKAQPDGEGNADGGWDTQQIAIDHTKMYRFTIWLKKSNSADGQSYFGCTNVLALHGVEDTNPYFWYGDLPELDKWFLLVGYIHGSGDPSLESYGGIYDGRTGNKVAVIKDFKFSINSFQTIHRTYLYYNNNVNNRQYFYAPRIDAVNGNEPTIEALLKGGNLQSAFFADNVGIGTATPREKLSVNGKIRAKEIKIETVNWPDYVFEESY